MKNIGILEINERAQKITNCVRFDKGSAKFPFPEEFLPCIDKVIKEIKGKYFHYPKTGGEQELKEQIVRLEAENNRGISVHNVAITHGGMSGLFSIFYLLTEPGDEVIVNKYCFEGFPLLIDHFKLVPKKVNLSNIDEIKNSITHKTKMIIFNSPENPTGKVYSQKEVSDIADLTKKTNLWLLSDEVMNQIIYNNNKWHGPSLKSDKVLIVNSFSKNWFIPGIRVGWVVAGDRKLINNISNLISVQSIGVNLFGQLLMAKILTDLNYAKLLENKLNILTERKTLVEQELNKNKINYLYQVQGGMNFYVDFKKDSNKVAQKLLEDFGIAMIPGYLFEGKTSTYARLGFGAVSKKEIIKGINIIASL